MILVLGSKFKEMERVGLLLAKSTHGAYVILIFSPNRHESDEEPRDDDDKTTKHIHNLDGTTRTARMPELKHDCD